MVIRQANPDGLCKYYKKRRLQMSTEIIKGLLHIKQVKSSTQCQA